MKKNQYTVMLCYKTKSEFLSVYNNFDDGYQIFQRSKKSFKLYGENEVQIKLIMIQTNDHDADTKFVLLINDTMYY